MTASGITSIVDTARVVVCCGPGGVGKTTIAAALGVAAAERGRRTCVVTVDPARRLADAFGEHQLSNDPQQIVGEWSGTLAALALDAKATFDDLVRRNAGDDAQATRILHNRLYRDLVTSLSGTQEYMATEKLHELIDSGRFDLVVVDTPPTHNALDVLAAPQRLAGFLDNRILRALLAPSGRRHRGAAIASEIALRSLGRVAGTAIVEDTVAFFQAFAGMEAGFRSRADMVAALLASDETAYVLVSSPRPEAVREVDRFARALTERGLSIAAAAVNLVHPEPEHIPDMPPAPPGSAWASILAAYEDARAAATSEAIGITAIAELVGNAPCVVIPLEPSDVHDLEGLTVLARRLLAGRVR